jgi:hypothetical protein
MSMNNLTVITTFSPSEQLQRKMSNSNLNLKISVHFLKLKN